MKFELPLIEQTLRILQEGLSDPVFEIQTDAVNAINTFNEYFFGKLKQSQTAKKQAQLVVNIQTFYQQGGANSFQNFLKAILFTLLFEENKNVWMFNKVLFSTVILVNLAG